MHLILTSEQQAAIEPHIRHGWTLIGKVEREMFTGTNTSTSGRLRIELGTVPSSSLPALRAAIAAPAPKATAPKKPKAKSKE